MIILCLPFPKLLDLLNPMITIRSWYLMILPCANPFDVRQDDK